MGGIFGALQMSLRTLSNMQTGIQVVNENVANVNTEGYSRKRVVFTSSDVEVRTFGTLGTGADIERIESIRDAYLESRILTESQALGYYEGRRTALSQLETLVAGTEGANISEQLSRFLDSFLELSADPSSLALRESVLAEAGQLAWAFRNASSQLNLVDQSVRTQITDVVQTVNDLLGQIGELNARLVPLLNRGQDGGTLYDERQKLLGELSELINVQVQVDDSNNMIISTSTGKLLLVGDEASTLTVEQASEGAVVKLNGMDITADFGSGKLGGLLSFQRENLAETREALDDMARELAAAVNQVHGNGYDLNGDPGTAFFSVTAGAEASTLAVSLSDPRLVAAAGAPGAIGDGANAQALADLRDQGIAGLGDQTLRDFYSQLLFRTGLASRSARSNLQLQEQVLNQLKSQRESVSGVSLDEEAVNLMQYQRSYQASAKLIRVLDSLLEETLNLVK